MLKTIHLFLFWICTLISVAQSISEPKDTIYFDADWKTTTLSKAAYYRPPLLKTSNNLYKVMDYFIDGNLQLEGYSKRKDSLSLEGKATWYYPNNNPKVSATYTDGMLNGEYISYHDNGQIQEVGNQVGCDKVGRWAIYLKDGTLFEVFHYENGLRSGLYELYDCPYRVFEGGQDCSYIRIKKGKRLPVETGYYLDGKKTGKWEGYLSENGTKSYVGNYMEDRMSGEWIEYYESTGKIKHRGSYHENNKTGAWIYYDRETGKIKEKGQYNNQGNKIGNWSIYDNGKLSDVTTYSQTGEYVKSEYIEHKTSNSHPSIGIGSNSGLTLYAGYNLVFEDIHDTDGSWVSTLAGYKMNDSSEGLYHGPMINASFNLGWFLYLSIGATTSYLFHKENSKLLFAPEIGISIEDILGVKVSRNVNDVSTFFPEDHSKWNIALQFNIHGSVSSPISFY